VPSPDRDVLTLARLARLLERACGDSEGPSLTLAQYRLLAMIGDGATKASQLAGKLALAKPTVSATVDTLVERGWVERTTAVDDRRVVQLSITSDGRKVLERADTAMRSRLDDVLAHVADVDAVRRALGALGDGLDEWRDERRAARTRG
jgi:DNA-binding MarR family transcriptional regulator